VGGASGHLRHLHDNLDLTFGELKDVLSSAADGKLERTSEKLDGINLVFTWAGDQLKVARSGGDIKSGGMDAVGLATKFQGRGNLADAFNGAFKVLRDAVGSLSDAVRAKVFNDGRTWYSIEVIYSKNPNVINYDANYVVFHASPVFHVSRAGEVKKLDSAPGVALLEKHVDNMQRALTQRSWQVRGPALVRLKKLSDGNAVKRAFTMIGQAQSIAGVGDDDTLGDYLAARMTDEVAGLDLPPKVAKAVTARAVGNPGAPSLLNLKKLVSPDQYAAVNHFVKASPGLLKKFIEPIERAVHEFAIEALRGMHSTLIGNNDAEVQRLRGEVARAVKAIEASGDATAMDVLQKQMTKLGSIENVSSAMEGVVFTWKGNSYKFTGGFAPANQILGLFKYGRKGVKIPVQEAYLRHAVARLVANGRHR